MYRIYFDTNDMFGGRYELGLPGSLRDIEPIADKLRDGMHVIIYMTNELEMEAVVSFDVERNRWMAAPVEGTIKYYE
jgi:hypothetical protein